MNNGNKADTRSKTKSMTLRVNADLWKAFRLICFRKDVFASKEFNVAIYRYIKAPTKTKMKLRERALNSKNKDLKMTTLNHINYNLWKELKIFAFQADALLCDELNAALCYYIDNEAKQTSE